MKQSKAAAAQPIDCKPHRSCCFHTSILNASPRICAVAHSEKVTYNACRGIVPAAWVPKRHLAMLHRLPRALSLLFLFEAVQNRRALITMLVHGVLGKFRAPQAAELSMQALLQ